MISTVEIKNVVKGKLKTIYGDFYLYRFLISNDLEDGEISEHLALVKGEGLDKEPIICRLNSACITSEAFNCQRCDCKWQLDKAMDVISKNGKGIITYHPSHEGRGFGLGMKLLSYNLMETGIDSSTSYLNLGLGTDDKRDFRAAVRILNYFNIKQVKMLGNNKRKSNVLENAGIKIVDRFSLIYEGNNKEIKEYLFKKSSEPDQDLLREKFRIYEKLS
ncbi:GTP cyclohydrolase II [Metabacillus halosaccharovorans]|uniref:GTP cyclohydrolase II domain-containing protein n=1 Tax=Metabacillus halosaccharovorans TaxID=930124 RepID=A0ABT3DLY7_9BACI|nr:hypothetical protein [Metabacillus halosaccharovorans]MCV9887881.1 hypothetical protein [Metabacillus halosaccharovorans]